MNYCGIVSFRGMGGTKKKKFENEEEILFIRSDVLIEYFYSIHFYVGHGFKIECK